MKTHYYICSLDAAQHISNTRIMYTIPFSVQLPTPVRYTDGLTTFSNYRTLYGYSDNNMIDRGTTFIILEKMPNEDELLILTLQCNYIIKHSIEDFAPVLRRMIAIDKWVTI